MSRDKQTGIHELAKQMSEAISTAVEERYIEDEAKLEAVLRANGWRKASDVAEEIFAEIEKKINLALDINCKEKDELIYKGFFTCEMLNAIDNKNEVLKAMVKFIAELKKKYESEKDNGN